MHFWELYNISQVSFFSETKIADAVKTCNAKQWSD